MNSIQELIEKQKVYFQSNVTLDISFRINQLKKLKQALFKYEEAINDALYRDLKKSKQETYLCEIGPTIMEINEVIANLKKWAKPEIHLSGLMCFPSLLTKVYKIPYGNVLIISPYNFPIYLTLGPLVNAIAAGNTAIIKPSSRTQHCCKVLQDLISDTFDSQYVCVVNGGHDISDQLVSSKFDKIFYTGSPKTAKHILALASENLTPVALELGAENGNWCIVRKDADLKDAAEKIAFFKGLNSGQICIDINQVAVSQEVVETFLAYLKQAFIKQFGKDILNNPDYTCMVNQKAFDKNVELIEKYKDKIVFGGKNDKANLKIEPTILYPIDMNDEIANKELFSPILPIITYKDEEIDQLIRQFNHREKPLALYLFTKNKKWANQIMSSQQYGGGCVNEVCMHLLVKGTPFNGVGHSGMGAYHGKSGFDEFSHPSTVLYGSNHFNLNLRKQPYSKNKLSIIKVFEK